MFFPGVKGELSGAYATSFSRYRTQDAPNLILTGADWPGMVILAIHTLKIIQMSVDDLIADQYCNAHSVERTASSGGADH